MRRLCDFGPFRRIVSRAGILAFIGMTLAGIAGGQATITEFQIPFESRLDYPYWITSGPDGNLWFTEYDGDRIGRITTTGVITEFPIPPEHPVGAFPGDITTGPDGALWFVEGGNNQIVRITPAGVLSEFPIPSADEHSLGGIAAGPDGALWFTKYQFEDNRIGRMTTEGVVTEFPVPTPSSSPGRIAPGPDGALWFTEVAADRIGRITTAGVITEFPLPTVPSLPIGITAGPDGAVWFTEARDRIGRITTDGAITEISRPTGSIPYAIVTGPDGAIWFTEVGTNRIARLNTTVVIGSCDSGVPNAVLSDGGTIADRIAECAAGAENHGDFVSCVSHLTNDLKDARIINGAQKGAIQTCASQAPSP